MHCDWYGAISEAILAQVTVAAIRSLATPMSRSRSRSRSRKGMSTRDCAHLAFQTGHLREGEPGSTGGTSSIGGTSSKGGESSKGGASSMGGTSSKGGTSGKGGFPSALIQRVIPPRLVPPRVGHQGPHGGEGYGYSYGKGYTAGYGNGYNAGYRNGYRNGYNFLAGKGNGQWQLVVDRGFVQTET